MMMIIEMMMILNIALLFCFCCHIDLSIYLSSLLSSSALLASAGAGDFMPRLWDVLSGGYSPIT